MNEQMNQNLAWLLIRASLPAKHVLMKQAELHDLTIVQFLTLCLLEKDQELPMNGLAPLLNCDPSYVTGIVDRLVTLELMERHECPTDRRAKIIRLTTKGLELRAAIMRELAEMQQKPLENLTAAELETLTRLLVKSFSPPPKTT